MRCLLNRLWGRGKRKSPQPRDRDSQSVGSERRRDLGQSYVEHQLTLEQLRDIYADSYIETAQPEQSDGLSCAEAKKRYDDGGPNLVKTPRKPSRLRVLINQHFYQFWILLIGASILSIVTYFIRLYAPDDGVSGDVTVTTAYILIPVVFLMSLISVWQERRTLETVSTNETTLSQTCTVIRDCQSRVVPAEQLVVGDLIFVSSGQRLPADIRILQSNSLKINNSAIIGRADPADYTHEVASSNVNVFDARNVAFQGTYCTEGDGIGLVIRVGQFTFLGNMAEHTWMNESKSLLRTDIKTTVNIICAVAITMAIVFFVIGIIVAKFQNVLYYFIVGFLIIIVANVPQGLPPAIMSYLAIIAKRLRRKKIYIKNLDTIDELGAATVIATSKAGYLTENCLTITDVWYNQKNHKKERSKTLDALHGVMGMCSRVWRCGPGTSPHQSVRRARAASIAAATKRRESTFATPRTKLFTVVHETGYESVRAPTDPQRLPSITSDEVFGVQDLEAGRLRPTSAAEESEDNNSTASAPITGFSWNSTDIAIRNYLLATGFVIKQLGRHYKAVYEIPYSSERRWQLVVCRCQSRFDSPLFPKEYPEETESVYVVMLKGAPEAVLECCNSFSVDGNGGQPISEEFREDCLQTWETYSQNGERTIAFALKYFFAPTDLKFSAAEKNFPRTELTFLGMVSLWDPPRNDTAAAIQTCKEAGLKVYMITGDHPTSAMAVATRIGLIAERMDRIPRAHDQMNFSIQMGTNWAVVHGKTLEEMTEKQWDDLLKKPYIVFARTDPEQTLDIVEACQQRNEIVALTGGSVNHAPALSKANVGIVSARNGTDIAQRAADIVLGDDSLSAILRGVQQGRILFENLQLSIAYTLAHLWPEVCPIILNFTVGLPLGMDPMQILSIDLACELPPAISLAYERPERDIMKCPPRPPRQRLVTNPLLIYSYLFVGTTITLGCLAAYFSVYYYHGLQWEHLFFSANDFWHGNAGNITKITGELWYDAEKQMEIRGQAAAAWQITLVISQVFHLFMCTTRRVSVFRHGVTSWAVVAAVLAEILLLCVFVYTPFMQSLLGIRTPPPFVWAFGGVVGIVLLIFTEFRKYSLRHSAKTPCARLLDW